MSVTSWFRRLHTRLFLSYLVVVAVGVIVVVAIGVGVTRSAYERRVGRFGLGPERGRGPGRSLTEADLQSALDDSLLPALLLGVLAALAAAALAAYVIGRRLVRPIGELGVAAQRMAAGDYAARVPEPSELELAGLAADINRLGAHLGAIEQRRSELLAEVTHELLTPVTVIRGQMEALSDGVLAPSEEVYAVVADEAARIQRLIDDLATLSRAQEGTLTTHPVDLDLSALASSVSERLRPQFEHAGVELRVPQDRSAPLRVRGDPDRLAQVLANLLGNALSHTPSGGTVTIRAGRRGRDAWVEVADTGVGIAAEDLDRIFDRFHRGAGAPAVAGRSARAGRGLGLTIARSLARAHGGDVVASSGGVGEGATFRLTLPAQD